MVTVCLVAIKKELLEIFQEHGGQLRLTEALGLGFSRYAFYTLRDKGLIEEVTRGVYKITEDNNSDLKIISLRFPKAVICLVSALALHGITTQIPREVSIAIERNSRIPSLKYPPTRAYKFSKEAFEAGIEKHIFLGMTLRVYSVEKTLADCFKYRNKIGMDIVLEALKAYKSRKKPNVKELMKYAKICRVEKIMQPYLEMLL